ncbi:MAG: hypothetical protein ACYS8W_15240, partial [Planctomycetota bacterium]
MTSDSLKPRIRTALFAAFCAWGLFCLFAYFIAQSEHRNVKVINYEARDEARKIAERGNVPAPPESQFTTYKGWDAPLLFLPYVGRQAGKAVSRMFEGRTYGKAFLRIILGIWGAVLAAVLFFIALILGRKICRLIGLPALEVNRPERFAIELGVGFAAFGVIFFFAGLAHLYLWWAIPIILVVISALCRTEIIEVGRRFPAAFREIRGNFRERIGFLYICFGIIAVLVALPIALSPAWSLDALVYHL